MTLSSMSTSGAARLKFLDGDFEIVVPGAFVLCAVTQKQIPLDDLRYWSVDRQEAYFDAAAANQAYLEALAKGEPF
ncbi:hypothetical protein PB2503_10564 [Parvularcula bermudensis HTCC2503]|uniref:DUF2093 domain-containing protein n=1 Tax=Parvularcula bermudensis (strain ATCC BAA-594 / HTCC2503 / KCTC 12087) TaxID=314260 RepID=E0TGN2_PARBH|nr:DUF2093 domain-containing protein [Parvularcula bermudensis]ADM10164.1 hypothetical protein PB2503_10564 [Parvularcula bermudensis HTCC2503]